MNYFKSLTLTGGQQSQQQYAYKLEDLINKTSGLGRVEKEIIFDYVKRGEEIAKSRREYITNVIIIFNSFFQYGFLRKSTSSSTGNKSSFTDEWGDSEDSNQLKKVEHYWEYMTIQFTELDSVRYINFYYEDASTNNEKALGWILLSLNQKEELKNSILEIFSNIPILQLYSKEESYLWSNRKEVLECIDIVSKKTMYNACPLLDNFIEYGRKKEEKKGQRQIMLLIDNKSNDNLDEDALDENSRTPVQSDQNYSERDYHTAGKDSAHTKEAILQEDDIIKNRFHKSSHKSDASGTGAGPDEIIRSSSQQVLESHQADSSFFRGSRLPENSKGLGYEQQVSIANSSINIQLIGTPRKNTGLLEGVSLLDGMSRNSSQFIEKNGAGRLNLFSANDFQENPYQSNRMVGNDYWAQDAQHMQTGTNQDRSLTHGGLSQRFFVQDTSTSKIRRIGDTSLMSQSQQSSTISPHIGPKSRNINAVLNKSDSSTGAGVGVGHQSNINLEESKRMIDRMFTEGDIVIPLHARKDFKMIFYDNEGYEFHQDLKNSDLVFLNEFYDRLRIKEYTNQKKQIFMKKKDHSVRIFQQPDNVIQKHSKNPNGYCGRCFKTFQKRFGLFEQKQFCYFCLDYNCPYCIASEKILIPNEYQLKFTVGKELVCQDAFDFIQKFQFIKIDKRNPMLQFHSNLRKILVLRRKVHKLFDLIKCSKWKTILELNGFHSYKNLILRETYMTFEQASDEGKLEFILTKMMEMLQQHVVNCSVCYYKGEKCQVCLSSDIVQIYEVDKTSICQSCKKVGHRQCLKDHKC